VFTLLLRKEPSQSYYPLFSSSKGTLHSQPQPPPSQFTDLEANYPHVGGAVIEEEEPDEKERSSPSNSFSWQGKSNRVLPISSPRQGFSLSTNSSPRYEEDSNQTLSSLSRVNFLETSSNQPNQLWLPPSSFSSSSSTADVTATATGRTGGGGGGGATRIATATTATNFPSCHRPVALCVDDSVLNRKLIGKYLEKHFNVLYAADGLRAVELVHHSLNTNNTIATDTTGGGGGEECGEPRSSIALILMDHIMPVMDGLEATRKIRELGFQGPIVGITGNCSPEQVEEFLTQGATRIVQKLVPLDQFDDLIVGTLLQVSSFTSLTVTSLFSLFPLRCHGK
jgi:CheY-like chemotaxis protein